MDKRFICPESVDQACQYKAGCGGIWQGVGASGRVGGSGRESGLQHRWRHVAGVGWCGRVWGHVAGVVAGCGGMWQGLGYLAGVIFKKSYLGQYLTLGQKIYMSGICGSSLSI